MLRCLLPRCSICMTATGCMCRLGDGKFRRVNVQGGNMLPDKMQMITSGLNAGQQVVSNALELQNSSEQ